jgi:hypothetical protein
MSEDQGFNLDDYFFDADLSKEGVWVNFFNGSAIKLAAHENSRHQADRSRLARKHRLQLDQANDASPELVMQITCECLAKHVLLDWKNINLGNETNVPYTIERGILALKKSQKLREFVTEQSSLASNFQAASVPAPVVAPVAVVEEPVLKAV